MSNKKITFVSINREADKKREILNKSIDELDLTTRASSICKLDNITTIGDLAKLSEGEMLRAPNCGRKTLNEFREVLEGVGLRFGYKVKGNFMVLKIQNTVDNNLLPGKVIEKQDILKFFDEKKYDEYEIVMRQEKEAEIYAD